MSQHLIQFDSKSKTIRTALMYLMYCRSPICNYEQLLAITNWKVVITMYELKLTTSLHWKFAVLVYLIFQITPRTESAADNQPHLSCSADSRFKQIDRSVLTAVHGGLEAGSAADDHPNVSGSADSPCKNSFIP